MMHDLLCVCMRRSTTASDVANIRVQYCVAFYTALAIDVGRQKLYYADSGNRNVGELSTDGTGYRVLNKTYSRTYAVVIDVDNR